MTTGDVEKIGEQMIVGGCAKGASGAGDRAV